MQNRETQACHKESRLGCPNGAVASGMGKTVEIKRSCKSRTEKVFMGKESRKCESQVSNIGKCVNVEGFSSAGGLGQCGAEFVLGHVMFKAPEGFPLCKCLKGEFWTEGLGKCLHHQRSLPESQST